MRILGIVRILRKVLKTWRELTMPLWSLDACCNSISVGSYQYTIKTELSKIVIIYCYWHVTRNEKIYSQMRTETNELRQLKMFRAYLSSWHFKLTTLTTQRWQINSSSSKAVQPRLLTSWIQVMISSTYTNTKQNTLRVEASRTYIACP